MPNSTKDLICESLLDYTDSREMTLQDLTAFFPREYREDTATIANLLVMINAQRSAAWQVVDRHVDLETEVMQRAWQAQKQHLEHQAGLLTKTPAADDLPIRFDTDTTRLAMEGNTQQTLADGSRLVSIHDAVVLLTDEIGQLQKEIEFADTYAEHLVNSVEAIPSMIQEHVFGSAETLAGRKETVERLRELIR